MVMDCSAPVPLSLAETCTIPLASISKVTSIWGTPRGAGGDTGQLEGTQVLVIASEFALHPGNLNRLTKAGCLQRS